MVRLESNGAIEMVEKDERERERRTTKKEREKKKERNVTYQLKHYSHLTL